MDNSSSSSVAAHLHQLANVIGDSPQQWFGRPKAYKVHKAIYASYNAFSRVDVIVIVNIPGHVTSYIIDGFGEKLQESEKLWTEVYASAVIRSLLTAEEDNEQVNAIVESRNLNPFSTVELATQFFDAFELLFFEGPNVGCVPELQNPSLTQNYLVDAFFKAVELTGQYEYASSILKRLREKEESVVSLIVRLLFLENEEVKAVRVLHEGIQKNPRDASLLVLQSEFLAGKGKYEHALVSATRAVNSAPSEFSPWANLSKTYLEAGDVENALLTLNSCPMASFKEKFHLKRIIPAPPEKIHLPMPVDVHIEDVSGLDSKKVAEEHQSIDQSLVNLQAANLKSTFAKAYEILTLIVHKTGWEALLKYRAKIFVMEEEYKIKSTSTANIPETNGNGVSSSIDASSASSTAAINESNSFKKKRLCERWLDNLFMLLYEDLKTYTMWQAETIHFAAQKTQYEKLPLEWEYLGLVAFRLHHYKEAAGAFQAALEERFAPNSTRHLLKYYQIESNNLKKQLTKALSKSGDGEATKNGHLSPQQIEKKLNTLDDNIVEAIVKLTAWNHRWYCEFAPYLVVGLADVVERQSLIKVETQVKAGYSDDSGVYELLAETFYFLKVFNRDGSQ